MLNFDRFFRITSFPLVICSLSAGCLQTPVVEQRNREMVYLQENHRILQEENRQLRGRIEGLEVGLERFTSEQFTQRGRVDDAYRATVRDLDARIAALERQTQLLSQQREQDKKEIVDTLSQKIAKLIQPPEPGRRAQPAGSNKRTTRSEVGYEHVVQPGQTLSEIATAYGVSIPVLIRENEIRDPNRLQAGQKLFIPE